MTFAIPVKGYFQGYDSVLGLQISDQGVAIKLVTLHMHHAHA